MLLSRCLRGCDLRRVTIATYGWQLKLKLKLVLFFQPGMSKEQPKEPGLKDRARGVMLWQGVLAIEQDVSSLCIVQYKQNMLAKFFSFMFQFQ